MAIYEIGRYRGGTVGFKFFDLETSTGSVNLNMKVEEKMPVFEWMNQSSILHDRRGHSIGQFWEMVLVPLESLTRRMLIADESKRPIQKGDKSNGRR